MPKKETDAGDVKDGPNVPIDEVGEGKGVEQVAETHFEEEARIAAFMEEKVDVIVSEDGNPESLPVVVITVNGKNQPIIRGRRQKVRRKYIETMARSRVTNYEQQVPDPSKPENIQMTPKSALTYPFTVINDSDVGVEWLNAILSQPM